MKHFSTILGLLAISACLQNANAMDLCELEDQSNDHQYTTTVEIEQTVSKSDLFKERLMQEIITLEESCFYDTDMFATYQYPHIDTWQIPTTMTFIDTRLNDDLFLTGLNVVAMAQNDNAESIIFNTQVIDSFDYVGLGLRNLEAYNVRVIGEGVFANNRKLSNVTISAHNDGLTIDKYAFANCETIDSFSIYGKIANIDNDAFMNTVVNRLIIDCQKDPAIDEALRRNDNIEHVDWLQDMSEDDY